MIPKKRDFHARGQKQVVKLPSPSLTPQPHLHSLPAQIVRASQKYRAIQIAIEEDQQKHKLQVQQLQDRLTQLRGLQEAKKEEVYRTRIEIWEARDRVMRLSENIEREQLYQQDLDP